jgi:hypothetical protein
MSVHPPMQRLVGYVASDGHAAIVDLDIRNVGDIEGLELMPLARPVEEVPRVLR